ncbi:MAG: tRNA (adenosine(37)-N6)-dimethylallyltransferase MiaA [Candidatus Woykebacteria bacterium]
MKKLLVVVGPTGTGKTDLALELAKKFDAEIISADSRQIYIGMDIGTGKIPQSRKYKKEKGEWIIDGVPIHLYDVIAPDKTFSVVAYQQLAYEVINEVHKRNRLPILVGGTGLYVRAVVEGLKIPKVAPNQNIRRHLEAQPLKTLVNELEKVDPSSAQRVDRSNPRRIIRALEIFYETGLPASELKDKFKINFDTLTIGLTSDREYLYGRVDKRINGWVSSGWVDEVKGLLDKDYQDAPSLTSLGYRQLAMYLKNQITLAEAKKRIKFEHHRYIRSQLTWFRKDKNIFWFDIKTPKFRGRVAHTVGEWIR